MKNLSDRIAELALKGAVGRNNRNRAAFMLIRNEVLRAKHCGSSIMEIWNKLYAEGRTSFSYQTFRRHVNSASQQSGWKIKF